MKKWTFILALAAGLTACSRPSPDASEQEAAEPGVPEKSIGKQTPESAKAPPLAWELFINKYVNSPTNGCISRSGKGPWDPDSTSTSLTTSCGDSGKPLYEVKVETPDEKENHYLITITHPIGGSRMSFTRDVIFAGEEIEFYRDDKWRIGIRPDSQPEGSDDAPLKD